MKGREAVKGVKERRDVGEAYPVGVKRVPRMNLDEHDVCKEDPFASSIIYYLACPTSN